MKLGINRKKAHIEVGDKAFDIAIFPIHAEKLMVDHDLLEKEFEKKKDATSDDLNEKNVKQYDCLLSAIGDTLQANGYEFDKDFWEANCDYLALFEFIVACKMKDVVPNAKKKATKEV